MFIKFWKKKEEPKKIRKRPSKREKTARHLGKRLWVVSILSGGVAIFFIGRYQYTQRLSDPSRVIQSVTIDLDTQIQYDNPEILKILQQDMLGVSFREFTRTQQDPTVATLIEQFPIIQDIVFVPDETKTQVTTSISYHPPTLRLTNQNRQWVTRDNQIYPLFTWDALWADAFALELPPYTQTYSDLEGIFYHIHEETLVQIIKNTLDILSTEDVRNIMYDPWGKKLHITHQDKLILFHLDKSLDDQLAKLLDITQYYGQYTQLSKIDLWSADDIIVK